MDSKRKASSPSVQDDCKKRIKNHHSKETSRGSATTNEEGIGGQLSLLEKTLRDIMESPESMRIHAAESEPDVMKAAVELDRAFRARSSRSPAAIGSRNAYCALDTYEDLGMLGSTEQRRLPPLPAIPDQSLEKAVFTHPGVSSNNETTYDRLEILGDAYIELIATKLIWSKFQELPAGRISQIRESLVKNETLSEFATRYGFDSRASVPRDYLSQPKRWIKTKGDIFEAYVAAVILSNPVNGYKIAETWLNALWIPQIASMDDQEVCLNAKETLAKRVMGKGIKLKYVDERPPVHLEGGKQTFFIGVYLTGWGWDKKHLGSGQGLNKVLSGNQAARQALLNDELINEIAAVKEATEAEKRKKNSCA